MVAYLFQAAEDAAENLEVLATGPAAGIMENSLLITAVGMLILFASLFVLWGVMELLVRVVKDRPSADVEEEAVVEAAEVSEDELKARAAAAAVAAIQDYDLKQKAAAAAAAYAICEK